MNLCAASTSSLAISGESMASGGARCVEGRTKLLRPALTQIFELMAHQESDEVGHPEARDYPGCAVAGSSRVIEGRVELGARNFDSSGAVAHEETIEPMRGPVERAAEIE